MKKCIYFTRAKFNLFLQLLLLFSFQGVLLAQNQAAIGMESKENNFSSFSVQKISNLESWKRINEATYYSHPEFGILPKDAPCLDCVEDLSKRAMDERYFVDIKNPNQFYQQKAMGQLHEWVEGKWITIDHRLKNSSNGIYVSGFVTDRAGFDVTNALGFLETNFGKLKFNQWTLILKRDGQLQQEVEADWSNVTIGDDGLKITSIFPGIDAEMRVLRGAIKTNFIIRSNEFGVFEEMLFTDAFDITGGSTLTFANGISNEGIGDVFVKNEIGDLAFIQQGILYAKNGPKDLIVDPVYRIFENKLSVVVPFDWINEHIDEYELIVDPLVTGTATLAQASILGSQYNATCNFTNSCNATLVVPRPANATITDVAWTFNYTATGACWREDGAVRFATGTCVSPATAGFYWFCNLASAGTCTGTNVSIINDLGGCLPAPSCVPVNVTFTMQFFRSCWGTTGCNNTCIGAASPWTMTITGQTLAYTNTVNNTTVSATTVCQGGSITASTSSTWGVPGYTYNWSFSPTGIPSVGSGASTTITFPTAGTITLYSFVTDACGNVVTSSRTITVTAGPVITATPSSQTICTGQSTGIALSSTISNTTYTWTVVQSGVSGASNGSQTGNAVSINQALSTTGSVAGTATYTITPTVGGCTGSPITVVVTVNPNLPASVSIAASASTVCSGSSVTFTATPTNGGVSPTYQWFVNGNPVVGQTASTFTSTTLTNGTSVTVQMTSNATPCLTGSPATSNAIPITVTSLLVPSVSVSANTTTACAGASITFTATPTNGGTSPTYQWFVNGNPVAGQTAATYTSTTLANGASVTVQMTSNATPCLSTPNATSTPVVVTINPSVTAAVSITSSSSTICQGGSATFTATPTNGGTAPTYQWFVNGNPVAGQTAATFTSTSLTNGASVTVQMTSNVTPCLIGSPATSNAINLTVNPVLVPAVTVVASSTTICAGSSITFTATPTNGGTAPTYQWFVNGNPVAGQTASSFTSSTLTNGASVTVQMTSNATPCLSPSSAVSSPITITVNPSITASVSIIASATSICAGDAITFTATPTNGGTAPTYQWFVNGNPVAGQTTSTFTTTAISNGASVTVHMTSNATPCLIGSPATSNALVITVNPILTAAVSISASSTTICSGTTVTFTATPTNGGTAPSYQWYINGGIVVGQTSASFSTNTLNNGDVVTVELTSNATPCLATSTVLSNAITIVLNPDLVASVSIVASTNTICSGSAVTFTSTPTNGGTAPTYQWFVNGNPVAGQTASTFTSTTLLNGASVTVQMASNATPCLVGTPATSNTEVIVVNPIPVITASNNGPLCVSEQLDLNATNIVGANYSWTGPQLFVSAIQNPSISNVSLLNAGTYTVTVNLNGCTATASTSVTIGTGTAATINPAGPFCVNSGSVTMTASAPNGVWSGPGITNPSTGTFDPTLATIGTNTISYTTPGACGGTSTMDIMILPIPTVSISSNVTTGCSPLQVTFIDNSVPTSSSVVWNFGNGETSSTSTTTTYTSTGCYDVTLTSTNAGGCSNTLTFDDFVCVLADPIADFNTSSYSTSMYDPSFHFVNQSTNALNYSWNFGNGTSSSVVNPSVTYPQEPGSYTVQLVAYNAAGCSDTISKIVTVTDELIFFVPNSFTPNGDEFNNAFSPVFTSGFDPYEFSFTIFNRWGETVFETKDATIGWDGTYHGEIVPEGVYTWTVRMKDIQSDKKYSFRGHLNVLK